MRLPPPPSRVAVAVRVVVVVCGYPRECCRRRAASPGHRPPAAAVIRAGLVLVTGLIAAGLAGVGAVEGDAGRGQREGDDLVDHPHVGVPGDHRFGDRVAGGRLRVLPGQVAGLAGRAAQPHLLRLRRAGALPQLRERDVHRHMGVRARPVRHHLRADQQLAALLQRVVEPLPLGAGVFGPGLLAERLQHGLHGGGAFRGEVAADHARAAERGAGLHVPVVEPVVIAVRP